MRFTVTAIFLSLVAASCGQSGEDTEPSNTQAETPTSPPLPVLVAAVESSEWMPGSASASMDAMHSSTSASMSVQATQSAVPTIPLNEASSSAVPVEMHSSPTVPVSSSMVMQTSAHATPDAKPSESGMMSEAHSSSQVMSTAHPSSEMMMMSSSADAASKVMSSHNPSSQMVSSMHSSSGMMMSSDYPSSQMVSSMHSSSGMMMSSMHTSSEMMSSADSASQMMPSVHTSSQMMMSSAEPSSEMMSSAHSTSQMMSSHVMSSHMSSSVMMSSMPHSSSVMMSSMPHSSSMDMMSSVHSSVTVMPTTEMPPVVKKENVTAVLTFAGDCTILTQNESLAASFKEILKDELLMNFTSSTTIVVGDLSCGSVKAEVTFVNAERPMVTSYLNNLDDNFVISMPSSRYTFTSAQVLEPPPPKPGTAAPPPPGKTAAPVPPPGLKTVDIVIIVVCAVVFTCCVLFGIIYCCVTCYEKRYTKIFELGETPSRHVVNSDDFTLTRLDRPTPLYNEKGPVIATDPVNDSAHYTTNSFQPEDRQTFSSFRESDVEANNHTVTVIDEQLVKRQSQQNLVHVDHTKSGIDNPSFSSEEILDSADIIIAKHSPQSESRSNNNSISHTHDSGTGTLEKRSDVIVVNDDSSSQSSKHSVEVVNEFPEDEHDHHNDAVPEPDSTGYEVHYDSPVITNVTVPDPVLEHHYDRPDDPTTFVVTTTDVRNSGSHSDSSDEGTTFIVTTGPEEEGDDDGLEHYDRAGVAIMEVGQEDEDLVPEYERPVEASIDFPPPPPPDEMVADVEFIDMVDDHIVIESPTHTHRHSDHIEPPMEFSSDSNVTTIVIDSNQHEPHDLHIPADHEVVVETTKRHSRSSSSSSSSNSSHSSHSDNAEGQQKSYEVTITDTSHYDEDATGF